MEFSRTEYWSRQPFPSPGDLPNPGIKPRSPALQADSLPAEPPGEAHCLPRPLPNPNSYFLDLTSTPPQLETEEGQKANGFQEKGST